MLYIAHTLVFILVLLYAFAAIVHALEVRYHTQGEVGQLRRQRGVGEGRGRGGGEERGSGGGRGKASAGQGCDET